MGNRNSDDPLALPVLGLVLWIVALAAGSDAAGWGALGVLVVVALLGIAMCVRWLPTYAARAVRVAPGTAAEPVPERSFPVAIVVGHGALAIATLILVLLTDLHVGG